MRRYLLGVLAVLVLVAGCMKEMKEPEPSPGLETVPFYSRRTYAFDSKGALEKRRKKVEEEAISQEVFTEEVKKRIIDKGAKIAIPDPWIPPTVRTLDDLPPTLRAFPKDAYGYPDWTAAVEEGLISPRASLTEKEAKEEILDLDILFQINDRLMANVVFPHKIHTYWLSCKICHPKIFKAKKGANIFNMYDIWNGKYCGRCHGKVAYQPKGFRNCQRCHSSGKKTMGIE